MRNIGNNIQLYNANEAQKILGTKVFHGMLYDKGGAHMNPLNYSIGIGQAIKTDARNVTIHENSAATAINFHTPKGHEIIVNNQNTIYAKKIVLAANYGNGEFVSRLNNNWIPISTFMLSTQPISPHILKSMLTNRTAVFDTRNVMNYFRLSETNCLLFGGGDAIGQFKIDSIKQLLYNDMIKIYPQLIGIKIQNFWHGKDSFTVNLAPTIGRVEGDDTIYHGEGYSGQGLALSNLTGKMFADSINGNHHNLKLFEMIKPFYLLKAKWFQNLSAKLGMEYFKILDTLEN